MMPPRIMPLATVVLLSLAAASRAMAEEHFNCRAVFDCTWALSTECGYSIHYKTGGIKNFTVKKGQTAVVDQLNPLDRYCFGTDAGREINGQWYDRVNPIPADNQCILVPIATLGETRFVCR
jgi:hypothetical protein